MTSTYFYLVLAVITEIIATSFLKKSHHFTVFFPTVVVIAMSVAAFYFLSLTVRTLPIGLVYAIWSGASIVIIAFIDFLVYGEKIDLATGAGMFFILVGVLIIHLFSKTISH